MANDQAEQSKQSPYSQKEQQYFKELLEKEHQETKQKIDELRDTLHSIENDSNDENSAAAHHQGDIASEEDEREKFLIMIEKAKDKITEINDALDRIENGTYGICQKTGEKIQQERLEIRPYARYSVAAQKQQES